jgi:hypothetical protein
MGDAGQGFELPDSKTAPFALSPKIRAEASPVDAKSRQASYIDKMSSFEFIVHSISRFHKNNNRKV